MEDKKKIKILVIPSDYSGCGAFRSVWPHQYIQEHYADEFDIDIIYLNDITKSDLANFLAQYDIVVYHKYLDKSCQLIDMVNFLGIPSVIDLDDNFLLSPDHPLYMTSKREGWANLITKHIKKSNYVTTTTPLYANILKKYNKNVFVLPNAIDRNAKQFQQTKKSSERLRFGLICGSTHLKDIELMKGLTSLPKEIMDKIQFVLCGWDKRGRINVYDPKSGDIIKRDIKPEESVWSKYEIMLTDNYKTISDEHKKYLTQYIEGDDPFTDEPYRRFWTKNINEYAKHYENVDVLLAPLKENDFNKTKSQLKVVECAFTDTAIIASDFGPYKIDLKPYIEKGGIINPEGNSLMVEPSKNHKQWAKYISYIVNHPECIEIMKNNLKKDICDKYSIENVSKDRVELYRRIYNENKKQ